MIPVGYLAAIGVAIIFTLYMDGSIGVMMLAFLLVMPILSLVVTLVARHGLQIEVQLPDECSKGKQSEAVMILTKRTVLPMPFLRLRLYADAHFAPLNTIAVAPLAPPVCHGNGLFSMLQYRIALRHYEKHQAVQHTPDMLPLCVTMGIQHRCEYHIPLITRYCGKASVRLTHLELTDFLRLFRFRIDAEPQGNMLILPQIPTIQTNNRLFQSVANDAITADDDSEATPVFSASSTPGYEHRDYIPGDSLKRVNWKLSSKRHKLMVRKDEPAALAKLTIILDFHRVPDLQSNHAAMTKCLAAEQLMIESALGLISLCLQQGYPCTLYYQNETATWTELAADMPEQVAQESTQLLRGGFRSGYALSESPALPQAITQRSDLILIHFSTYMTDETVAALESLAATLHIVQPVSSNRTGKYPQTASLWQINEEHSFIPLQT